MRVAICGSSHLEAEDLGLVRVGSRGREDDLKGLAGDTGLGFERPHLVVSIVARLGGNVRVTSGFVIGHVF